MNNKYKIVITHNVPTWDSFQNSGINESYSKIEILMKVYKKSKSTDIYSIKLVIKGNYHRVGSKNFEINEINKKIIKDCDDKDSIYKELQNNYKVFFKNTVIYNSITNIFEELCDI